MSENTYINDISRPRTEAIAGQLLEEVRSKPKVGRADPELGIGKRERRRGNCTTSYILTENCSLKHFLLPG